MGTEAYVSPLQPLTKFTSAVFQSELYLPDYVAKDKGFDAAHGIVMNFVTPSNGAAAAQLMLAGQVQGWFTDPLIVLTAAAKGQEPGAKDKEPSRTNQQQFVYCRCSYDRVALRSSPFALGSLPRLQYSSHAC